MSLSNKRLVLKLGSACNLHCKHCHCSQSSYRLNEDIFDYIKRERFFRVTFSGGEPLLYMDTIKNVVNRLPKDVEYKIVTNGTLLTPELVKYFNNHNFKIYFSYDGENDSRDHTYIQCWHDLADIDSNGLSTLFSSDTDPAKLFKDVIDLREKYNLNGYRGSVWANFVHQTKYNVEDIDRELVKQYCSFIAGQLELDMRKFKDDPYKYNTNVLVTAFNQWIKKYRGRGIKCFNECLIVMALNGEFLLCPYDGTITVGNIYTGVDWDKIESFIPDRCKGCPQWESCGNTCIANTTTNECFISKVMYHHFYKLMKKYNITYEEINEVFNDSTLSRMNTNKFCWLKDIGQKIKNVLFKK